jgi:hypothetical protein
MNFGAKMVGVGLATLAALTTPVLAQSATGVQSGPVHVPAGYATNAPMTTTIAPAASLAGPVQPAVTNAPSAAAPAAASTGTADSGDIHDIRGVVSIPYPLLWLLYIVGGVALAAVLYYAWRWLHRTVIRPKLPHEIALERLEAARALMSEGQVREYAFAVSEAVRLYIEQRFGEKARRRTTEEFINDLLKQTGTPLAEHRALLEDFLMHCDLPKFARWQLSTAEMESMHESARAFINNTRPGAPVAAPASAVLPPPPVAPAPAQPETASAQ